MRRWFSGVGLLAWLLVAPVSADAPPSRYTFPTDGTVFDSQTKLTWQREVPRALLMNWDDAKRYCAGLSLDGTGWRLPIRSELLTLVDPTRLDPTIDVAAFSNTPSPSHWWSSSAYAVASGYAWSVNFGEGFSDFYSTDNEYRVRCVR